MTEVKSIEVKGKTLDEAIFTGLTELGLGIDQVEYEIIKENTKGIFGIGRSVIIRMSEKKTVCGDAEEFLNGLFKLMGTPAVAEVTETDEAVSIELTGDPTGMLIGRRGETLDALQYLTGLVVNKGRDDYKRVSIDIGDYRQKREETLEALARKLAAQAVRTGRSVTLEPMNPYERRVIHSAVQEIEGATSRSIGEEPNRRVIISSTTAPKKPYNGKRGGRRNNGRRYDGNRADKPAGENAEKTVNEEGAENAPVRERTENRDSERREYRRGDRRDGGRGRGPKPEQPVSTRPAEVKEEAKDKPLYGKIEL